MTTCCRPPSLPSPVEQFLKRSRSISEGSDGGEVACVVKRKKERRKEVVITPKREQSLSFLNQSDVYKSFGLLFP